MGGCLASEYTISITAIASRLSRSLFVEAESSSHGRICTFREIREIVYAAAAVKNIVHWLGGGDLIMHVE
jgi:hypothetical protein